MNKQKNLIISANLARAVHALRIRSFYIDVYSKVATVGPRSNQNHT